jgi:DNA-binding transcriptional LysR family regulator
MLDWHDLQNFLAIARHGSLSAAARAAGVRQSTMGRRLAALEARAGVTLLQKTPRGYVPTEAGEAARVEAERMEAAALAAERAITGRDVRPEGEVRLTTVESFAAELVTPILARFGEKYPGITVTLITERRTLSLAAREADLAVRLARPRGAELLIRKLGEMRFGLYAAPDYLGRHGTPSPDSDGSGHRLILMEEDVPLYPEILHLAQRFPHGEIGLRSNSRYVHREACAAGLGIACLAHYLAAGAGLIRLPGDAPSRELWLAQHRDTRHTLRIRALAEALSTGIRLEARRLGGRLPPGET